MFLKALYKKDFLFFIFIVMRTYSTQKQTKNSSFLCTNLNIINICTEIGNESSKSK